MPQAFARTVKKYENKAALIFEDQTWTFRDLENYSNRVANYFLRAGYKPGQTVALFMENRLEYVGIWVVSTLQIYHIWRAIFLYFWNIWKSKYHIIIPGL